MLKEARTRSSFLHKILSKEMMIIFSIVQKEKLEEKSRYVIGDVIGDVY